MESHCIFPVNPETHLPDHESSSSVLLVSNRSKIIAIVCEWCCWQCLCGASTYSRVKLLVIFAQGCCVVACIRQRNFFVEVKVKVKVGSQVFGSCFTSSSGQPVGLGWLANVRTDLKESVWRHSRWLAADFIPQVKWFDPSHGEVMLPRLAVPNFRVLRQIFRILLIASLIRICKSNTNTWSCSHCISSHRIASHLTSSRMTETFVHSCASSFVSPFTPFNKWNWPCLQYA